MRDGEGAFVESRTTVYDITERKKAEAGLKKVNRALRILSDARQAIIRGRSESELLGDICRLVVERGGYRRACVLFGREDDVSTMKLAAEAGQAGGIGISSVSVPLKDRSGVFGRLSVYTGEPDAFDTEEVALLEELGDDVSFALGSLWAEQLTDERATLKRDATETAKADPLLGLSPREREVLKLVAEGQTSKEIAAALGVAPSSVDTYRSRLMIKAGVRDVSGLVRFAIRKGVIQP